MRVPVNSRIEIIFSLIYLTVVTPLVAWNNETQDASKYNRKWTIGATLGTTITPDYFPYVIPSYSLDGTLEPSKASLLPGARRLALGANVEYALSRSTKIQTGALYRPLTQQHIDTSQSGEVPRKIVDHTFEVPLIVKYQFNRLKLDPFIGLGSSARLLDKWDPMFIGTTISVGIQWYIKWISVSPSIRYTRWFPNEPRAFTKRDQLQLIVFLSN